MSCIIQTLKDILTDEGLDEDSEKNFTQATGTSKEVETHGQKLNRVMPA